MLKINKRSEFVFPISQPANISTKCFCIRNISMEVMFQIETDYILWFLFLEKLIQNLGVSVYKRFWMIMAWMVFPNFSQNINLTWLGSFSFEIWHSKVRFEYFTISGRYFLAEIMEKLFWFFISLPWIVIYFLI